MTGTSDDQQREGRDCPRRACWPAKYSDSPYPGPTSTERDSWPAKYSLRLDEDHSVMKRGCWPAKYSDSPKKDPTLMKRDCWPAKYSDSPKKDPTITITCPEEDHTLMKRDCWPAKYSDSPEKDPTNTIPEEDRPVRKADSWLAVDAVGTVKSWRDRLQGKWKTKSFNQRRVCGMDYSTIVQVPSTKNGRLMKELVKIEPQLARITGYNVKVVEKSGIQLSRLFQRVYSSRRCQREGCPVCAFPESSEKPTKCKVNNIVYEAVCIECEEESITASDKNKKVSRYIGESSRTLAERSKEHVDGAKNCEYDNFIVKHWVSKHKEMKTVPRIRFKVLKTFQDALSRLTTESVLIDTIANMNSKSEFRNNKVSRIVVENPRERKTDVTSRDDEEDKVMQDMIDKLRKENGLAEIERGRRGKRDIEWIRRKDL